MNGERIGVFDSGVGGLTVMAKLARTFPAACFCYLGDNGNMPYGNLCADRIRELSLSALKRLAAEGVGVTAVACNTASLALGGTEEVDGMKLCRLRPHIPEALAGKRGVFFATAATAERAAEEGLLPASALSVALPTLAERVEKALLLGTFGREKGRLAGEMLGRITTDDSPAYLFLGCTHYLYLKRELKKRLPSTVFLDGVEIICEKLIKSAILCSDINADGHRIKFIGEYAKLNEEIYRKYAVPAMRD